MIKRDKPITEYDRITARKYLSKLSEGALRKVHRKALQSAETAIIHIRLKWYHLRPDYWPTAREIRDLLGETPEEIDGHLVDGRVPCPTREEEDAAYRALCRLALATSVRCSTCGKDLEHLGDPRSWFSPTASVLGSPSMIRGMEQWRGLVCRHCRAVYCVDCVGYVGDSLRPKPCPKCGMEPLPATRQYLSEAGIL